MTGVIGAKNVSEQRVVDMPASAPLPPGGPNMSDMVRAVVNVLLSLGLSLILVEARANVPHAHGRSSSHYLSRLIREHAPAGCLSQSKEPIVTNEGS